MGRCSSRTAPSASPGWPMASRPSSCAPASGPPSSSTAFARGVADVALLERTLAGLRDRAPRALSGRLRPRHERTSRAHHGRSSSPSTRHVASRTRTRGDGDVRATSCEIHDAEGAFERLEAHLRAAGFFEAGGRAPPCMRRRLPRLRALASRCVARPGPRVPSRRPCRWRPAGSGTRTAPPVPRRRVATVSAHGSPPGPPTEYAAAVGRARQAIAAGEVYQVNLVQHLSASFEGDPAGVAAALAPFGPLHGRPLTGPGWAIVSASPELFLARRGRRVWTMPIKGTRPRGGERSPAHLGQGRRRARHDRGPRAQRPGPHLRAGQRSLARAHARPLDGRGRASRLARRGSAAPGRLLVRDAPGDVPRRIGDGSAEGRGPRPHRSPRAGRARRLDGRPRHGLAERRLRPRADHPDLRHRRRPHPPLGRRRAWSGTPSRWRRSRKSWVKARPLLDAVGAAARDRRVAR